MATIGNFLQENILKKVNFLRKYTLELHSALPPSFIRHCQVANFTDQQLVIAVTSPAWAHQLKYYVPVIQSSFQQQSIKFIICPELADLTPTEEDKHSRPISPTAANTLESSAASIQDPKLKEAMLKLASHGKS